MTWNEAYEHLSRDDKKAKGCGYRYVGLTLFKDIWRKHFPGLRLAGTAKDVCKVCRSCTFAEVKSSLSSMTFKIGADGSVNCNGARELVNERRRDSKEVLTKHAGHLQEVHDAEAMYKMAQAKAKGDTIKLRHEKSKWQTLTAAAKDAAFVVAAHSLLLLSTDLLQDIPFPIMAYELSTFGRNSQTEMEFALGI